jgi:RNA polymerase sigma-70 factor (ECF subfamily)
MGGPALPPNPRLSSLVVQGGKRKRFGSLKAYNVVRSFRGDAQLPPGTQKTRAFSSMHDVTRLLKEVSEGSEEAPQILLPLVYEELRKLAHGYLRNERADHTLQATALVHEAYLRLVDWQNVSWQNRAHFFAVAAQLMRRVLIDYARQAKSEKRGGDWQKVALDKAITLAEERDLDIFALDEALTQLAGFDEQQCRIIELRFFGGLTIEEAASVLGLSPATVKREWTMAKTWLYQKLNKES